MTRGQLRGKAGISTRALAKMVRGEDVNTDVLRKYVLRWIVLPDIVEIVPDEPDNQKTDFIQSDRSIPGKRKMPHYWRVATVTHWSLRKLTTFIVSLFRQFQPAYMGIP